MADYAYTHPGSPFAHASPEAASAYAASLAAHKARLNAANQPPAASKPMPPLDMLTNDGS